MENNEFLGKRFEAHRAHLRAVAYRMLGSLGDADDAVQEAWLRLSRSDTSDVENLGGWLTTVVGRVCLDMLRSRRQAQHREESLDQPQGVRLPDQIASREDGADPEQEAVLADSVGIALLSVLETLSPTERLVLVLHDVFGVPFDELAPIVSRSPSAARQLASRARRRVRGAPISPDTELARLREVVDAFLAAARDGDFDALLAVLDPDVALHVDYSAAPAMVGRELHGAPAVANETLTLFRLAGPNLLAQPTLVNGAVGRIVFQSGESLSVMCFTVARGKIVAIRLLVDQECLFRLGLPGPYLRPAPRHASQRTPRFLTREPWVFQRTNRYSAHFS